MSKRFSPLLIGVVGVVCPFVVLVSLAGCGSDGPATTEDTGTPADATNETSITDTSPDSSPTDTPDTAPLDPTDRSLCAIDPDKTGLTKREVKSPGGVTTWTYAAYVPTAYDPKKLTPMLIALHGAGDLAENYLTTIWQDNADKRGFLVLAAEGSSKLGAGFTYSSNDAKYISNQLLTDFARCYTVDPKQRVIHGFAAGGTLAYLMGLGNASMYSGIAIASADFNQANVLAESDGKKLLPPAWLIPISHTHGTGDTRFPIASARDGRDKLLAAGLTVAWHEFEGDSTTDPASALVMWDDLAKSRTP